MRRVLQNKEEIATILLGFACAVIIWITILGREGLVDAPLFFQPFHSFRSIVSQVMRDGLSGNFLGNIIMFVPVGFLLPEAMKAKSWRSILFIGGGFSLAIETTQLITSKGFFEIDDIILNTVGVLLGNLTYRLMKHILHKYD